MVNHVYCSYLLWIGTFPDLSCLHLLLIFAIGILNTQYPQVVNKKTKDKQDNQAETYHNKLAGFKSTFFFTYHWDLFNLSTEPNCCVLFIEGYNIIQKQCVT